MSDENKEISQAMEEGKASGTGQKKVNIITSILLIAYGAFIIIGAIPMKIMDKYAPSSGLFPLMVGILICVISITILIENLNPKKPDSASKFKNVRGIMKSAALFVALMVFCVLLRPLGYILDTFALVVFIMAVIERTKLIKALITAASITLLLFLIFQVGLKTTLPQGILEGILRF